MSLTSKQIAILERLAAGKTIIAPWTNHDLGALQSARFVASEAAIAPNGRLHTSKIWRVTDAGASFIAVERRGQ